MALFVISLQNKVLYRAAFYFLLYVVIFGKPPKINFLRFQKKAFIQMREKEVTGETKQKAPACMQGKLKTNITKRSENVKRQFAENEPAKFISFLLI